ncbi:MAG TPA: S-layer homology domain-containing protein [Thermoanaerobaculia bacterium]|nr:S-layer homology domain-containing protein [Thermoanaerobaculia bacterium]
MRAISRGRWLLAISVAGGLLAGEASNLIGTCGPFTDVAGDVFCPFVLEIFYMGITTGTTATTYDPTGNVTRLQMAAFLSRTVDRTLQRGGRRAALNRFWTSKTAEFRTDLPGVPVAQPAMAQSDGTDVWVTDTTGGRVYRVRGSDGKLLDTLTGATGAYGILAVHGVVYVGGHTAPGSLYSIDAAAGGPVNLIGPAVLGDNPLQLAYDGLDIWSANQSGSVSYFTGRAGATTVTTGFTSLFGILFDGSNMWVTDASSPGKLSKLDSNGAILQSVTVGTQPRYPIFDGSNIWVPNYTDSTVSVVRASTGAILATLSGNGLNGPAGVAFDGQRILVTNYVGDSFSLWKAGDLTTLGSFDATPLAQPNGVCSDGLDFWIPFYGGAALGRF